MARDSPDLTGWSSGVGLSNPQLAQGRRTMLDLVNRLHSTGSVFVENYFYPVWFSLRVAQSLMQCASRHWSSPNCCHWFTKCWKVFAHWGHIRNHSASSSWDLYTVRNLSLASIPYLTHQPTSSCPTECRLSRSDSPWQCIVSLRFITDAKGQLLGQARNEVFGSVIYEQSEVEERIRRAQKAILNPKKPPKDFLDKEDEDEPVSELNFSTNCVSLQISGPEVADLSFCDLPGMSMYFALFLFLIDFVLKTHQVWLRVSAPEGEAAMTSPSSKV